MELELQSSSELRRLEGYPSFAEFIAKDKDAAIYRRYESLSARNLLYQQSELHQLQKTAAELDQEEAKDIENVTAQQAARYWNHFANDTSGPGCVRRALQDEIKIKMKAYHEALILESQVLALSSLSPRVLEDFKRWFTHRSLPVLHGHDEHLFDNERDLVALAPVDTDRLNMFLMTYTGWFFREKSDSIPNGDMYYVPERRIQRAGAVISVLLSAVLLIGAIVCLMLTSNSSMSIIIGMIVLFTCLFAVVIGLLTNARRAEIFGSTAAYAAVLVVFVSNNIGGGRP